MQTMIGVHTYFCCFYFRFQKVQEDIICTMYGKCASFFPIRAYSIDDNDSCRHPFQYFGSLNAGFSFSHTYECAHTQ